MKTLIKTALLTTGLFMATNSLAFIFNPVTTAMNLHHLKAQREGVCHVKIRNYKPVTSHCEREHFIGYDFPGNGSSRTRWEMATGTYDKPVNK